MYVCMVVIPYYVLIQNYMTTSVKWKLTLAPGCPASYWYNSGALALCVMSLHIKLAGKPVNFYLHTGIPSAPMINSVTGGVNMFTLTVQLYAGHTSSLYFNVSIINTQTNAVLLMPDLRSHTSVSPNLMNYTITVLFGQSGQYRFTVSAGNQFGRTMESESYPSMMMDGVGMVE